MRFKLEVQIAADEDGYAIEALQEARSIARLSRGNKSQPGVQSEGEVAWGDEPRRLAFGRISREYRAAFRPDLQNFPTGCCAGVKHVAR